MTIEFRCSNCQRLLKTSDDRAGAEAVCPDCGMAVRVPWPGADQLDDAAFADAEIADASDDEWRSGSGPARGSRREAAEPAGTAPGMKTCPMCGESIKAIAVRCRYCGEVLDPKLASSSLDGGFLQPHRGGTILALGILGWVVCFPLGIAAWIMGNEDLAKMQRGQMDRSGEGLTRAGRILGIVQCTLLLIAVCAWCLLTVAVQF